MNGGGYVHREVKVEIQSLGTFQGKESDQPGRERPRASKSFGEGSGQNAR